MTTRACPICDGFRVKSGGKGTNYLHCRPCGTKEIVTLEVYESIQNKNSTPQPARDKAYGIADCIQPKANKHPDCTGKLLRTQSPEQNVCMLCQRYERRGDGRNVCV